MQKHNQIVRLFYSNEFACLLLTVETLTFPIEEDLHGLHFHIKNSTLLDVSHAESIHTRHPPNLSTIIGNSVRKSQAHFFKKYIHWTIKQAAKRRGQCKLGIVRNLVITVHFAGYSDTIRLLFGASRFFNLSDDFTSHTEIHILH